ncbi:hypothetical protein KBK24_0116645 [Burkholderia sp. K24]|nr:hypothetical protein KBK24_0116645 [Burkholderia sp. K24]
MLDHVQMELLSSIRDVDVFRVLLADLHDDMEGKVARFRQLADLSMSLGSGGTMMPGGETALAAWTEARSSFVHGNFVATIMLCQGLAEHVLAAHLLLGLDGERLPDRVSFVHSLTRCVEKEVIAEQDADDLRRLMKMRNPLTHYRSIDDPSNLSRRVVDTQQPAEAHLLTDATFAMSMAIRLLSLPVFRLGD